MKTTIEKEKLDIRRVKVEHRAKQGEDGKKSIDGYALLYEHRSKMIFEYGKFFYEEIARGALDEVLKDPELDVLITPNHDLTKLIARTKSGTLKLVSDETGLRYIVDEVPDISYANDTWQSIKRGDIYESSFIFYARDEDVNWSMLDEGVWLRRVNKISYLREVAPVTNGAYSQTKVQARSLKDVFESHPEDKKKDEVATETINLREKELQLLKLKR